MGMRLWHGLYLLPHYGTIAPGDMVREIWKEVMVQALAFGNAVPCIMHETGHPSEVRNKAEWVGTLAMGAHGKISN